uniref:WAS/WASL interacting protein family member 3 n=1 Tax=Oryzias sinensis TaxID=183150 RepID=A0A8C7XUV5_9TELE
KVAQINDRSAPIVDSKNTSGGKGSIGPSLGGLFAAGFPTLRPIAQRDLAGKTSVSRSNSSSTLRPLWNPPASADPVSIVDLHRTGEIQSSFQRLLGSSSAPPSPSHSSKHPPPFPATSPSTPPTTPPSAPPPPPAFQDRPANKPPPLPSCPPPPPPYQPSIPPPPPPPVQADRSSGCFYSPPASVVYSEPSRFPILRDSPLGPPPPPPAPPLPASISPSWPSTLPPPPPKAPSAPSLSVRSLPPSYPCNPPTRRPPAVPRGAGMWTQMQMFYSIYDFESKFQFHPVEDLPPPDEFKPFPRIYPSKENRGTISIFPFSPNAAVFMFSFFLNASSYSQPHTTWDTNTPQMNHGLKMNQLFLSSKTLLAQAQLYCHKTVCVYLSCIGPECLFASVKTASRLIQTI